MCLNVTPGVPKNNNQWPNNEIVLKMKPGVPNNNRRCPGENKGVLNTLPAAPNQTGMS